MRIRQSFLILILVLSSSFAFSQNDLSLFNSKGKPVAYMDTNDEDLTIYLWSGKPVAYISKKNGEFNIYGFNGKHLGWFIKGMVRDHEGDAVGSTKEATNSYKEFEPFKSFKQYKPFRSIKEFAPFKPFMSSSWSTEDFTLFLLQGVDDN